MTHTDDQGNTGKTQAGDVQVMSAGTGIRHAEQNDGEIPVRLFQIWLKPSQNGDSPQWGSKPFPKSDRDASFIPLASGRDASGALSIRLDAEVAGAIVKAGSALTYTFQRGDAGYLVPATGEVEGHGIRIQALEGLVIQDESAVTIRALQDSELLLIVTAV